MRRNTIIFIIMVVIFAFAAAIVFPIDSGALFSKPVKLGLDLKGGVHIVYPVSLRRIEQQRWMLMLRRLTAA
jgi:preprotein translocase subunit SecD